MERRREFDDPRVRVTMGFSYSFILYEGDADISHTLVELRRKKNEPEVELTFFQQTQPLSQMLKFCESILPCATPAVYLCETKVCIKRQTNMFRIEVVASHSTITHWGLMQTLTI